jgi:hypothetical protein
MLPKARTADFLKKGAPVQPTDEHRARAVAAIQWIRQYDNDGRPMSDYEHNLITVCKADHIRRRSAGIAAALLITHQVHLSRELERASAKPSVHIGEVGDKVTLKEVLVTQCFENSGTYGISFTYIMKAPSGAVFKWTTKNNVMDQGTSYKIVGTVKDHAEYRGVPQTILTRCKVLGEVDG